MRKLFAIALCCVMLLSLGTVGASAAGKTVAITTSSGKTTEYSSLLMATEELQNGDTLKLLDDVSGTITTDFSGMTLTIDGNGKKLTGNIEITAAGGNLTIKNITVDANQAGTPGILIGAGKADARGTVYIENVDVRTDACSPAKDGIYISGYNDTVIEKSKVYASNSGISHVSGATNCKTTVRNTTVETVKGYCFYGRLSSEFLLENCTFTPHGYAGVQIQGAGEATASTLTCNNCTINAEGQYCFAITGYHKFYINGGTYNTTGKFTNVYMGGVNAYCKITDGTFTNNGQAEKPYDVCSVAMSSAKDGSSVLDIYGGTFVYDSATIPGSAIRGACASQNQPGTVNIYGGTFISNGTLPVIDAVMPNAIVKIEKAKIENSGTNPIAAYTYTDNNSVLEVGFSGTKTVLYVGEAPVVATEAVTTGIIVPVVPVTTAAEVTTEAPAVTPVTADNVIVYVAVFAAAIGASCVVLKARKKND